MPPRVAKPVTNRTRDTSLGLMSRSSRTDIELLQACRAGERDAFGGFYARYREAILAYLARRVRDPEAAADLMAETFASALVAVMELERTLPDAPAAWLFGIARNELVDAVRRGQVADKARRQLALAAIVLDDRDIERINDLAASADFVEDLSAQLPAHEWEALRDHVLNDETYSDLATRIGCSEAVVRKRVSRAKAHLRTVLRGTHA